MASVNVKRIPILIQSTDPDWEKGNGTDLSGYVGTICP
jgi:hypothetical protein